MIEAGEKVYGGVHFYRGIQRRTIVIARSAAAAAKMLGVSPTYFRLYWTTTGNKTELSVASSQPGKIFAATTIMSDDYRAVKL